MRRTILIAGLALALTAGSAPAQSGMTLDAFVTQANRIPMNPTSALRSDTRRLMGETNAGFTVIRGEIRADRAAGRTPTACPPEKIELNPRQLLTYLNAIPQPRRARMSVPDGLRAWLADRYPCPR
ncbi:MAG TPA: hypothetical protein VMP03_03800 [Methylomirabilota bacterium]|nr:hypothetical protein [Methylomirabilota bacterium]